MTTAVRTKYDVGGIMLDRPFKIRRLGHFGFNVVNMTEARRFYVDLLGFKVSDVMTRFGDALTPVRGIDHEVVNDPRRPPQRHIVSAFRGGVDVADEHTLAFGDEDQLSSLAALRDEKLAVALR